MAFGRAIRGQTQDFGALLQLPCPQCNKDQWFNLKQHSSSFGVIGIELGKSSSCSLHCKKCEYPIDIETEDAQKAAQFLPITKKFIQEEIAESDFKLKLDKVGFKFLKEIETANTNWTCPNCNEECPMSFSECWNCGHQSTLENN